ncbi:MAG: hypothetical protein LUC16_01135 [Coprobacillus sp.]|nr:hypothetical protein [Coprobacillus sp.]
MVFALVLKAWGLGNSEVSLELIIIYYVSFFLLMIFIGVQIGFIIVSFKKDTAILNNVCFKAKGRVPNKYCTYICLVMIVLFLFFFTALALRLAGVWMFMEDMENEFLWTSLGYTLLLWLDPAFILIYQRVFRRDFLIGNINLKVQKSEGGDEV